MIISKPKIKHILTITLCLIIFTQFSPIVSAALSPTEITLGVATGGLSLPFSSGGRKAINDITEFLGTDNSGPVVSFTDFKGKLAAPSSKDYAAGLTQATDARTYIKNVVNFALGFLGLITVVIVIYGGFLTIFAAGDPTKATKGKQVIITSGIGILIIIGSFAIVNTLLHAPGGNETGTGGAGSGSGPGQQTIRGVAGTERYNFLATQMQALMQQLAHDYNFYFTAKSNLGTLPSYIKSVGDKMTSDCGDFTTNCDDWKSGIGAEIDSAQASMNNIISYLNTIIASPNSSPLLSSNLKKTIDKLNGIFINAKAAALNLASSNGCNKAIQTIGNKNYCNDNEAKAVLNAYIAGINKAIPVLNKIDLATSYKSSVKEVFKKVNTIHSQIKGLTILQTGTIGESEFSKLISKQSPFLGKLPSSLISEATTELKISTSLTGATLGTLKEIEQSMSNIVDILKNLKFVNTVITADTSSGNAPLIVNFSTVGSTDPSGQTITPNRILWDLNGDGQFSKNGSNTNCNETVKSAVASCIFTSPGTYRVTVKILPPKTIDPVTNVPFNQEIAPGIAYVDIKVNPPATKINLVATFGGTTVNIIKYNSTTGKIAFNRSTLYLTPEEAKSVTFNATATTSSDGKTPILTDPSATVKWDFGTANPDNNVTQVVSKGGLQKTISYPGKGTYVVKMEVTDKNNDVDRKIFSVVVSDLAPRLTNPPKLGKVGKEIIFDGSNSSSNGGKIIFNWTIEKLNPTPIQTAFIEPLINKFINKAFAQGYNIIPLKNLPPQPYIPAPSKLNPAKISETNKAYTCNLNKSYDVLKCDFKQAGQYKVSLYLQDGQDPSKVSQLETSIINIISNPPIAGFTIIKLGKNAPALYKLNASALSFDPDESNNNNLEYSWKINPNNCVVIGYANEISTADLLAAATSSSSAQTSCSSLKDYSLKSAQPVVKFTAKGDFTATLQIRNYFEQNSISKPSGQSITVNNILDLSWGNMIPTAFLKVPGATSTGADQIPQRVNNQPVGAVTFLFKSSQAISWEMNFGDGETQDGDFSNLNANGEVVVTHNYTKIGKYKAKVTVYDADDIENSITRNITIGNGTTPVAVISIFKNQVEVQPEDVSTDQGNFQNTIIVSRQDQITFKANQSVNTDGTGKNLKYDWNINDGDKRSLDKQVNYQFKTLSQQGELFNTKLIVTNQRDLTQTADDSVNFLVVGIPPYARSLNAVPQNSNLTTPVSVKLTANGVKDPDGHVVQYTWWYSPANDLTQRLGLQITTSPTATINIGTRGNQGEKHKYIFGLELTDNDNLVVSTDYQGSDSSKSLKLLLPTIEVTNGANKPPIAKFSVDKTTVNVGDSVNFISASSDPNVGGGIKNYQWDFGDGTQDSGPNKASVSHIYKKANINGYKVRLTVTDVSDSTSTSDTIKIYAEAQAKPPVAAFISKQQGTTRTVNFTNKSTADTGAGASLKKYAWDFNINVDSNGDGIKNNDLDSTDPSPTHTYDNYGIYRAKLTVEDSIGQQKSVTNFVNVKPAGIVSPNTKSSPSTPISTSSNKSLGANLFEASNSVNPFLLYGSLIGYVILLLIFRRKNKNKIED